MPRVSITRNIDTQATVDMGKSHKDQHWIPKCYLRGWTDPAAPTGYDPYVHVFTKDGAASRKKAPSNLFTQTDLYTIKLPDGGRDLRLEHGLAGLEASFSETRRDYLSKRRHIPFTRYFKLLAFLSAMHSRTPSRMEHFMGFWNEVLAMGDEMERNMKGASKEERRRVAAASLPGRGPTATIDEIRKFTSSPMENTLVPLMESELPLLMLMRCIVLCTASQTGFITSDSPVVWFDPDWHRGPPLYRSPCFSDPRLEITLPMSPTQMLILMHGPFDPARPVAYLDVGEEAVTELNRRTRFRCDKEFVVRREATEPRWFDAGTLPPDAWELNEGKESFEEPASPEATATPA
jgi:hypothetical protein